jgi:CRISPR-associated endonuclease Csn1
MKFNPYELRAKAVSSVKLAPFEMGRVFLHLAKRRGFLSNRKTDATGKEGEGLRHEIEENETANVEAMTEEERRQERKNAHSRLR